MTPTDDTYLAALYGLTGRGEQPRQLDLVARAFAAIEGAGAPPSTSVQQRVAVSYAFGERWQKSIDMFEMVVSDVVVIISPVRQTVRCRGPSLIYCSFVVCFFVYFLCACFA